jgi:hypothetical protein
VKSEDSWCDNMVVDLEEDEDIFTKFDREEEESNRMRRMSSTETSQRLKP